MIVTVAEAKEQLGQTLDIDDDLITAKIGAAQAHIERLLGYEIEATYGGDDQDPIPDPLREAVMQLVAAWYENREATVIGLSAAETPLSVQDIVREYRTWSF